MVDKVTERLTDANLISNMDFAIEYTSKPDSAYHLTRQMIRFILHPSMRWLWIVPAIFLMENQMDQIETVLERKQRIKRMMTHGTKIDADEVTEDFQIRVEEPVIWYLANLIQGLLMQVDCMLFSVARECRLLGSKFGLNCEALEYLTRIRHSTMVNDYDFRKAMATEAGTICLLALGQCDAIDWLYSTLKGRFKHRLYDVLESVLFILKRFSEFGVRKRGYNKNEIVALKEDLQRRRARRNRKPEEDCIVHMNDEEGPFDEYAMRNVDKLIEKLEVDRDKFIVSDDGKCKFKNGVASKFSSRVRDLLEARSKAKDEAGEETKQEGAKPLFMSTKRKTGHRGGDKWISTKKTGSLFDDYLKSSDNKPNSSKQVSYRELDDDELDQIGLDAMKDIETGISSSKGQTPEPETEEFKKPLPKPRGFFDLLMSDSASIVSAVPKKEEPKDDADSWLEDKFGISEKKSKKRKAPTLLFKPPSDSNAKKGKLIVLDDDDEDEEDDEDYVKPPSRKRQKLDKADSSEESSKPEKKKKKATPKKAEPKKKTRDPDPMKEFLTPDNIREPPRPGGFGEYDDYQESSDWGDSSYGAHSYSAARSSTRKSFSAGSTRTAADLRNSIYD
jgi:hypothetical protein